MDRLREMMTGEGRGPARAVLLIFVIALTLRLAAIFYLRNWLTVPGYEALEVSKNILAGHGFSIAFLGPRQATAYQYPLYTFFFLAHYVFFGRNFLPLELSQALLGAASCVLTFWLGRRLFEPAAGFLAGLAGAVYPTYVYWVARAQALTLEVFLLLAMILLLWRALERDRVRDWLAAGAVVGLGALSKTLYLIFVPSFLVWAWLLTGWDWRRLARRTAIYLLAAAAVIAPWTVRNYSVFHRFIPVSANGGYNLWIGNNPAASGGIFAAGGKGMWETMSPDLAERLARSTDLEKDEILRAEAMSWIAAHPGAALRLVPERMRALWWFEPYMPSDFPLLREVSYLALLVPALAGLYLSRRWWRRLSILYLPALTITAVYSIYYGGARFRYLIEFALMIFAGHALHRVWSRLWPSTRRGLP